MSQPFTRRRAIGITAAAAGLTLVPVGGTAPAEASLVTWQGHAMGALASLRINHTDRRVAERLVQRAVSEVRRLERIFSLYHDDSPLAVLNRTGVLLAPPKDLVVLLHDCQRYWELTGGLFDATVQSLWALHRDHFTNVDHDPGGPSADALRAALDRVGFSHVTFDINRVVLGRRGMGLTLNGIAQGYATDRVVRILRSEGIEHSLVDMGESRVLGGRSDGRPWRIGIADPKAPERIGETLDVRDAAVATSGAYGFRFDPEGRFNHLFDPRSGGCAARYRSVTVVMPTATAADALSTAFSLMPEAAILKVLTSVGVGEVHVTAATGKRFTLGPT